MRIFRIRNILILVIAIVIIGQVRVVNAQPVEETPTTEPEETLKNVRMRNVFLNVLWGSLVGGLTYTGISFLDDQVAESERYSASNIFTKFVSGATYGGIVGLGAGVYLSFSNISFDQGMTRISLNDPSRSRYNLPPPIRPPLTTRRKEPSIALFNYQMKF